MSRNRWPGSLQPRSETDPTDPHRLIIAIPRPTESIAVVSIYGFKIDVCVEGRRSKVMIRCTRKGACLSKQLILHEIGQRTTK